LANHFDWLGEFCQKPDWSKKFCAKICDWLTILIGWEILPEADWSNLCAEVFYWLMILIGWENLARS